MLKFLRLVVIITAGETIFVLPFLIPRLYRPLMLEAWDITNQDIGLAFSAYGLSSMLSYIFGGPFADKYPPQKLMTLSLMATGLGGLFLLWFPSKLNLIITYFYFGISTILLMWGALIKVTHEIGGESHRATAMGILDSGRGLTAALLSTALILIVSSFISDNALSAKNSEAMDLVLLSATFFTFLVAALVWWVLRDFRTVETVHQWSFVGALKIFESLQTWLLGVIILSAYCGYKSIDLYSIYLVDVQGMNIGEASKLTSVLLWLRPLSALAAGLGADYLANHFRGSRFFILSILFGLGAVSQLALSLNFSPNFSLVFATIVFSSAMVYAMRAIYFAVFGELQIPDNFIGTTVGFVSLVGYLPDLFFGSLTGYLIDQYPGLLGYTYSFGFTAILLFIGALACFVGTKSLFTLH